MRSVIRSIFCRVVARLLVAAMVMPMGLLPVSAAPQRMGVLVLTLENKSEFGGDELAQRVTDALIVALEASDRAAPVRLVEDSPSLKRAVDVERTLSKQDLRPPWDAAKAARVGKVLGVETVLIGSIDKYSYDAKAKIAEIILTVQQVEVSAPEAPKPIVVNGVSSKRVGAVQQTLLTNEAIDNAAAKIAQTITGAAPIAKQAPPKAEGARKERNKKWLLPALAVVALIAVLGRGGGGGGGVAPQGPISNAFCQAQAGSMLLSWEVSSTVAPESFNIYRAPAGNAPLGGQNHITLPAPRARQAVTGPYEKIMNVRSDMRSVTDAGVVLGKLYAYQIKAVIAAKETAPIDFKNKLELPIQSIVVGPGVPIAPRNIQVGPGPGALVLRISWDPNPEAFVTGYRVYRGTTAASLDLVRQVAKTQTALDDSTGLVANQTYFYVVAALGASVGATPIETRSAPVSRTLVPGALGPPTNLTASASETTVTLTWTPSIDQAVAGYNIYRNGAKVKSVIGQLTSTYTDTGLASGQTYKYFLKSFDASTPPRESPASNEVTVTTTAPPKTILCDAKPASILGNGVDKSTIRGQVLDNNGHPVGGKTVRFHLASGPGTLVAVPPGTKQANGDVTAPTDSNGIAQAALQAPRLSAPAASQVTASVENVTPVISCSKNVQILVPTTASLEIAANPTAVVANGTNESTITATAKDASGVGVPNVTVAFSVDNTSIGVPNPTSAKTDAFGRAMIKVRSAAVNAIGTVQVTATAVGKTARITVSFVAQPSLTVSVSPTTIPAGGVGSTALITATVKQADGTPVGGQQVRFGFNVSGAPTSSSTGATIAPAFANSDGAGLAFATLTSPANLDRGNADVILAWIDSNASGAFESGQDRWAIVGITYTEAPASVTVTADPAAIPADGTSTSKITAVVLTAIPNPAGGGNKPVADGTIVRFQTSAGKFTSTEAASATATTVNGVAFVTLRAAADVGTATVTATAASVSNSAQVQFQTVPERILEISASPGSIASGGGTNGTSQITVLLRKPDGTPVPSVEITFTSNLGTLTPTSCVSGADGKCTVTLTSTTVAGTATVTASAGSQFASVLIAITGGTPARITLAVAVPGRLAATGGLPSPAGVPISSQIVAAVTDANGNPVPDGTPVLFRTDIGGIQASATTVNGVAIATLVASTFEVATNFATFQPGVATVFALAGSEAGPKSNEEHVLFCGNAATATFSGAPTSTDHFCVGGGADFVTGAIGGFGSEPNLRPVASDSTDVEFIVQLFDANNNPLPMGVEVVFHLAVCGVNQEQTVMTSLAPSGARAKFKVTKLAPNPPGPTKCLAACSVDIPGIISSFTVLRALAIQQWFGAAAPATIGTPVAPTFLIPTNCTAGGAVTFPGILDAFGNKVQNGTSVCFNIDPATVTNMTLPITLNPLLGSTLEGTATVLVNGRTTTDADGVCKQGSAAIRAGLGGKCPPDASPQTQVTATWKLPG
jgi:hypothetical protein